MIEAQIMGVLKDRSIGIAELAARMGTSTNQAYRLLRPKSAPDEAANAPEKRKLTYDWLVRIAKAIGVTPGDLLPPEDNPHRIDGATLQVVEAFRAIDASLQPRVAPMLQAMAGHSELTSEERRMLAKLRSLDDASQAVMRRLLGA